MDEWIENAWSPADDGTVRLMLPLPDEVIFLTYRRLCDYEKHQFPCEVCKGYPHAMTYDTNGTVIQRLPSHDLENR
jgi:hypothetical protein